ncbi:gamma-glutamyltransferase [Verrucomicrobia bacterium]|nr:gamma-glutamyltransferase [Verrucomicrobiota bacterium]
MKTIIGCAYLFAAQFVAQAAPVVPPTMQHHGIGRTAIAASGHPLATDAALAAFRIGGNAVDAAVATGLTLGVVDGHNSGIGGGCFMLIHLPDGEVLAIDGREMAPAKAHRDLFIRDGKPESQLSKSGALASGIPGSLAVYDYVLREYGNLRLADLLLPAATIAEKGFPIDAVWARKLKAVVNDVKRFPYSASILLRNDGTTMQAGDIVVQKDLAKTYRAIASKGVGHFYGGSFASKTAEWMEGNDGIITERDFKNYIIKLRKPVQTTYRGHTIYGFPPPSSGGVHVAQVLNMLEGYDVGSLRKAERVHLFIEAEKRAFADRAFWLGDADFAKVPRGLIDEGYARQLAEGISLNTTTKVPGHGNPPKAKKDLFNKHTTHFTTADAEGYWVACTATVNTGFGSKVMIPGTGVIMNNQMDDFSAQPGVPNAFHLIGAEANSVQPGKRPLSSMSPTIVAKDGKPVMTVGAAGGPTIITQTLLAIIGKIDLHLSLLKSIELPRYHHQWSPDEVRTERELAKPVQDALKAKGHKLYLRSTYGVTHAISVKEDGGFEAVSDPRVFGRADGF